MKIQSFKSPLTVLLGFVLMLDVFVAYRCWLYRPWLVLIPAKGVPNALEIVSVWTWMDSLLTILIVALQLGLVYLVWRSRRAEGLNE